jgi:phage N-6-adenine-methyltransferase
MAKFGGKFETVRQDWETPAEIFGPLNAEFGFTCDVAASHENAKCERYFTEGGLERMWNGVCWMNPPYREVGRWVKKAFEESSHAIVVCLVPARTNTNWWHDYCMKGEVRFIRGRPRFGGAKHGLPQPLAVVIFPKIAEERIALVEAQPNLFQPKAKQLSLGKE